jgi:hypothetical protein
MKNVQVELEKKVIKLCAGVLSKGSAGFYEGTLIIEDAPKEDFETILMELTMLGSYGNVRGTVIEKDSMFAIDFVA